MYQPSAGRQRPGSAEIREWTKWKWLNRKSGEKRSWSKGQQKNVCMKSKKKINEINNENRTKKKNVKGLIWNFRVRLAVGGRTKLLLLPLYTRSVTYDRKVTEIGLGDLCVVPDDYDQSPFSPVEPFSPRNTD